MNPIETLRQFVLQSTDLNEPLNYFFDLMDEHAIVNMKGHREVKQAKNNAELLAVIAVVEQAVNQRLGKTIQIVNLLFHEIPEHGFFHGLCMASNLAIPLTVIYFANVQTGVLAATDMQKTDIFRFSLTKKSDMKAVH